MGKKSILFYYINGQHHIYHTILTAMELSRLQNRYEIILVISCPLNWEVIQNVKQRYPDHRCKTVLLPQPFLFKYCNIKKKQYPPSKVMFKKSLPYLTEARAVISTSHDIIRYALQFNIVKPKFIYQYHGCGEREYGFDPLLTRYDKILIPGNYHKERLVKEDIADANKTKIVGWPKLDLTEIVKRKNIKLFKNNKPTVLYTPHWELTLGSYKKWGEAILDYFYNQNYYNLIFAPHILIRHCKWRYGYNTRLNKYRKAEHILIDFSSLKSIDMTYLHYADIYLGDVSSLIYEWIAIKPRPCLFLNAHNVNWKTDVNYRFWHCGQIVNNMNTLHDSIKSAISNSSYLAVQKKFLKELISQSEIKSSIRAAEAILKLCSD